MWYGSSNKLLIIGTLWHFGRLVITVISDAKQQWITIVQPTRDECMYTYFTLTGRSRQPDLPSSIYCRLSHPGCAQCRRHWPLMITPTLVKCLPALSGTWSKNHNTWDLAGFSHSQLAVIQSSAFTRQQVNQAIASLIVQTSQIR